MKRSTYIRRLRKAKRDSIDKRWAILIDDEDNDDAIDCPFCKLNEEIYGCESCPFVSCSVGKDNMFRRWMLAPAISQEERDAAQAIIDFIESINVTAWADTLVERGLLEEG